jgi:hypothetical protein
MPAAAKSTVTDFFICGFLHFMIGVGLSMVFGLVPEAFLGHLYYNTGFEAFGPAIALTGLILGFFFSVGVRNGQGASLAWIFGAVWLGVGFHGVASGWSPMWAPEKSSWDYAVANLFGRTSVCSASECLIELLFTKPSTASITYSIGSLVRKFSSWPPKSTVNS